MASFDSISVVITHYNKGNLLLRAVRSICFQLHQGDEVVLIDDGSSDEYSQKAANFLREQWVSLNYIKYGVNKGPGFAKAQGIHAASKQIVVLLDSDDELPPDAIDAIRTAFSTYPEADFIFGHYKIVDVDRGSVKIVSCREIVDSSGKLILKKLAPNWVLLGSSPFRKAKIGEWNNYHPGSRGTDDIDFWRSALRRGAQGQHIDTLLYIWNRSSTGNNAQASVRQNARSWFNYLDFYREYLPTKTFGRQLARNLVALALPFPAFFLILKPLLNRARRGYRAIEDFINRKNRFPPATQKPAISPQQNNSYEAADRFVSVFHHFAESKEKASNLDPSGWISGGQFEEFIRFALKDGYHFVSIDEHTADLAGDKEQNAGKKTICLTIDDGYRSVVECALPVLEKYDLPFAMFVCGGFAEGTIQAWWTVLESVLRNNTHFSFYGTDFNIRSLNEKKMVFNQMKQYFLGLDYAATFLGIEELAAANCTALQSYLDHFLDINDLGRLASNPSCTLVDHSYSHLNFTNVTVKSFAEDIRRNQDFFERNSLGEPHHFAFPYGLADSQLIEEARRVGYKSVSLVAGAAADSTQKSQKIATIHRLNVKGIRRWSFS